MKSTNHNRKQNKRIFSNMTAVKRISIALLLITTLIGLSGCQKKTSEEHISAAKDFVVNGDQQSAIIELKNAIQVDPQQAEARFELGNLYLGQNNYQAAEKELNRAMELGQSPAKTIPLLARPYQRTGPNTAL